MLCTFASQISIQSIQQLSIMTAYSLSVNLAARIKIVSLRYATIRQAFELIHSFPLGAKASFLTLQISTKDVKMH